MDFYNWLQKNATYEGYGEWSYEDSEGRYSITDREDVDCDGYDIWSEEEGTTVVICGSDAECLEYMS